MSSDLWAAFGSPSQDTKPDTLGQPALSTGQQNNTQGPQAFNNLVSPQPQPSSEAKDNKDDDSDADSWSAVNQELENAWNQPNKGAPAASNLPSQLVPIARDQALEENAFDDDDFGDFEEAEQEPKSQPSQPIPRSIPQPSVVPKSEAIAQPDTSSVQIDDDFGDFEEAEKAEVYTSEEPPPTPRKPSLPTNKPAPPAKGPAPSRHRPQTSSLDLLGDDEPFLLGNSVSPPRPSGSKVYDPFADLDQLSGPPRNQQQSFSGRAGVREASLATTSHAKKQSQDRRAPLLEGFVMAEEHPDPNEVWDDFSEPSKSTKPTPQPPEPTGASKSKHEKSQPPPMKKQTQPPIKKEPPTANELPPTNVPPPSILIPMVATIVQELPEEIDNMLRTHEEYKGDKSALTRALDLLTALEDRLSVIKVAARILAGRKLRWKRDMILGQNMRISAAGRPGGMKLTGVDKAETQREEREASEFVRLYKKNSGRIRGAIAKMPAQVEEKPPIPPINEIMPVRTLKEAEGAQKSLKCCIICGLKREERVDKIDLDVWDQFAEWWTEHWGHTECRTFWNSYEHTLQQR